GARRALSSSLLLDKSLIQQDIILSSQIDFHDVRIKLECHAY
ncbi:2294_t:CDS:1, partial [Funneliformis geosporum]